MSAIRLVPHADSVERDILDSFDLWIRPSPDFPRRVVHYYPEQIVLLAVVDNEMGQACALGSLQPDRRLKLQDQYLPLGRSVRLSLSRRDRVLRFRPAGRANSKKPCQVSKSNLRGG